MGWKACPFCVAGTCGLAISNRKMRGNYKGHRFYRAPAPPTRTQEVFVVAIKRPDGGDGTQSENPVECDLALRWSNLWEFLVDRTYEDGGKRVPGTVLLFREDCWFKALLNDKDTSRIAFCAGDSLEACLDAAELGLRDSKLDWRKSKPFRKG